MEDREVTGDGRRAVRLVLAALAAGVVAPLAMLLFVALASLWENPEVFARNTTTDFFPMLAWFLLFGVPTVAPFILGAGMLVRALLQRFGGVTHGVLAFAGLGLFTGLMWPVVFVGTEADDAEQFLALLFFALAGLVAGLTFARLSPPLHPYKD